MRTFFRIALCALVLAAIGCAPASKTTGSVSLAFNQTAYQASIMPPIGMQVVEYSVIGDGPGSTSFGPLTLTGAATIDELVPGSWTITAVGKNVTGDAIGEGAGVADIVIGQTSTMNITVAEYTGDGSYALSLSWEPNIVTYPIFAGELKDSASVVTPQVFVMDAPACTAISTTTPIHAGWYANVVKLFDAPTGLDGSEVLSTGFAEAVRIAANQQTAALVSLHAVQGYGEIDINFSLDFADPLVITGTPAFGAVPVYAEIGNVFSVSAPEAAVYVWYLRGQQMGTGSSYTLDASALVLGEPYRLDVIGFSVDGRHAGSGTFSVTRTPAIHVTGLSLTPASVTIYMSDWEPFTPLFTPANATIRGVTWTSSNPAAVTVEVLPDGRCRAARIGGGSVTITGTTVDGGFVATAIAN
jgi:uncharacterized protein YjdB